MGLCFSGCDTELGLLGAVDYHLVAVEGDRGEPALRGPGPKADRTPVANRNLKTRSSFSRVVFALSIRLSLLR